MVKKEIIEELTDEQIIILEEDMNKAKLRKIDLFMWRVETPNEDIEKAPVITFEWEEYNQLLEKFKIKWEELLERQKKELETREETKLTLSQTDMDNSFWRILKEYLESLWESEWEKVIKEYFEEQIEAIDSNIYNKQEELYDAPVFSYFDLLKKYRCEYLLIGKRIEAIRNSFQTNKQKLDNPNPYED